jgi:hypothetical protein
MLLRLLPQPTEAQANPPTILFTLAMPAHPYTAKSLPLPANLLAHKTVCLQEDLDCPNVLLGEKSSWLQGVSQTRAHCHGYELMSDHYRCHILPRRQVSLDHTGRRYKDMSCRQ